MINLNTKKMVSDIEIIDLDIEIFTKKIVVAFIFKIKDNDIYVRIALINQNTIVLLQIILLKSEI